MFIYHRHVHDILLTFNVILLCAYVQYDTAHQPYVRSSDRLSDIRNEERIQNEGKKTTQKKQQRSV